MLLYVVPGGPRRQQPFPRLFRNRDAVRGDISSGVSGRPSTAGFVELRIEVSRRVVERAGRGDFLSVVGDMAWQASGRASGCAENFILRGYFRQLSFKAFILSVEGGGLLFEGGELRLEIFDMAFLAFTKGSLTTKPDQSLDAPL